MSKISVVVPVYFNSASLPELARRIMAAMAGSAHEAELIFVDDGSGDDSFGVIRSLQATYRNLTGLRLSRNFGSNAAILAGLTQATGDAVVIISADLQDPPEHIPELVKKWEEGCQVVVAARRTRQDPVPGKWAAMLTNRLFRRYVFKDYPVNGFDFMLVDRQVSALMCSMLEKNSYIFGQALWVGFKREVIYYDRLEREHGVSRWTLAKKVKYLIDVFAAFSYLPLRAASVVGVLLASMGFIYAVVIFWLRWRNAVPVPGWTALTIIVLIASGLQLILLGILGEYIWRVLDEVRRRPPFIIAENRPPE